ncbi:DUF4097 family beta strand repeat-containing protein [Paenibacillus sp. J2TS4]|uniref:DUF4097 family beta strand repeat-containing protein n=1 Tax=Paenibacillus sp. J2TS4 TaxID=2807194 RepID=UPI001B1B10B1|nr:DUF4097 family beta strand repeat-containing protein [Paenibacillus sp. J2TS4]GIP31787.1 hypothetical protein J2TS4_09970 [Paenibacillus sp. J2TS4]
MRKILLSLLIVSIMLVVSGCDQGGSKEHAAQSIPLNDAMVVNIHSGSIAIELESAEIDDIEIRYDKQWGLAAKSGVSIDQDGDEINIRIESPLAGIGRKPRLLVRIPAEYEGEIYVNSSSGRVTANQFENKHIAVNTKSGHVSLDFAPFHSHVHVSTTSGNIQLKLNTSEPDINFHAKTGSGKYFLSIPIQNDSTQNHSPIEGKLGEGTYEIDVNTTSGNITVK